MDYLTVQSTAEADVRAAVTMQLHNVNGDGTDNRLENIVFLCANCHSRTDTDGGRNGHRRPSPQVESGLEAGSKTTGNGTPTR